MDEEGWHGVRSMNIRLRLFILLTLCIFAVIGFAQVTLQQTSADSKESSSSDADASAPQLIRIPSTGYKAAPPSELSQKGQQLFADLNCAACHSIHNVGGTLGPILDGVGGKRSTDYMKAKLTDSEAARKQYSELTRTDSETQFPHVRLSKEFADPIVAYLLTVPEPADGYIVEGHGKLPADHPPVNPAFKPAPKTASSEAGAKVYSDFGCVACHSISNRGGWLGPNMDGIGGRRSREYIVAHIANPNSRSAGASASSDAVISKMPRFKATDDQIQKIADFLETLPNPQK